MTRRLSGARLSPPRCGARPHRRPPRPPASNPFAIERAAPEAGGWHPRHQRHHGRERWRLERRGDHLQRRGDRLEHRGRRLERRAERLHAGHHHRPLAATLTALERRARPRRHAAAMLRRLEAFSLPLPQDRLHLIPFDEECVVPRGRCDLSVSRVDARPPGRPRSRRAPPRGQYRMSVVDPHADHRPDARGRRRRGRAPGRPRRAGPWPASAPRSSPRRSAPPACRPGAGGSGRRRIARVCARSARPNRSSNSIPDAVGDHRQRPRRGEPRRRALARRDSDRRARRGRPRWPCAERCSTRWPGRTSPPARRRPPAGRPAPASAGPTPAPPSRRAIRRSQAPAARSPRCSSSGTWAAARSAGVSAGKGIVVLGRPLLRAGGAVAAAEEVGGDDGMARRVERLARPHQRPPPGVRPRRCRSGRGTPGSSRSGARLPRRR